MAYGIFNTWLEAERVFANILNAIPENYPIHIWPIASVLMGEDHPEWSRDLVKQFEHLGALEIVVKGHSTVEHRFIIHKNMI